MAEESNSEIKQSPTIKYDVATPKRLSEKLGKHPRLQRLFLEAAKKRAKDTFEKSGIGKEIKPGERVLDIGTGTGHVAQVVEQQTGANFFKLDLADLRSPDTKDNRFIIADASKLPFSSGCFDIVSLMDVLHHCPNQEEILSEAMRILKPGGKIIIIEDTLPEKDFKQERSAVKALRKFIDDLLNRQSAESNPYNYHSINEWKEKLVATGFAQENITAKSWKWGLGDWLPGNPKNLDFFDEGLIVATKSKTDTI
ncbi:MAG: class I SAM-dependent methyltransferase [Patescibacteria group bacterium]|nr:class I SAM-dependent methyltransferase [Actinomycetota bacterium]MCL5438615.1 class I SAM-dependent methyltransferase [Patescibacteria group bacterium]